MDLVQVGEPVENEKDKLLEQASGSSGFHMVVVVLHGAQKWLSSVPTQEAVLPAQIHALYYLFAWSIMRGCTSLHMQ